MGSNTSCDQWPGVGVGLTWGWRGVDVGLRGARGSPRSTMSKDSSFKQSNHEISHAVGTRPGEFIYNMCINSKLDLSGRNPLCGIVHTEKQIGPYFLGKMVDI